MLPVVVLSEKQRQRRGVVLLLSDTYPDAPAVDPTSRAPAVGPAPAASSGTTWNTDGTGRVSVASGAPASGFRKLVYTGLASPDGVWTGTIYLASSGWNAGLLANAADPQNACALIIAGTSLYIFDFVADTAIQRAGPVTVAAAGGEAHAMKLVTDGDTVDGYWDGVLELTYTVEGRALQANAGAGFYSSNGEASSFGSLLGVP